VERIGDGVTHRYLYAPQGPWAINVLDVDLSACNAAVAVKGADTAAGRTKTSVLLGDLSRREQVLGGVNGDFFTLATGVPIGLLVVDGHMLTPPDAEPALAIDSSGIAHIAHFSRSGSSLSPFFPREAVGGRIGLVRDGVILVAPDTAKEPGFVARNPRTAAGISRDGRHLILATIDGRQKPYSDGTTLHETAAIMLGLGARDALNLDGGGSTTLVYRDAHGELRVANRPSDKGVERAVGDAVAIVRRCP
jgi:exopolysaccharide biosynthesis protein